MSRRDATRWSQARLFAVVLLALLVVACAGGEGQDSVVADEPVPGGTFVIGSISDVDAWNEYLARQTFSIKILRRIYEPLARETVDGSARSLEPVLAESWAADETETSWTFRLAERSWSDGRPVTADDVRFTWLAQTSDEVAWAGATAKQAIRDVEVVDDRTVVFHFVRRYPEALIDAIDGGILPHDVYGEVPFSEWRTHDWRDAARVGSGPFLLDRHKAAESIRLVRNPSYPQGPMLDAVVVRVVPDLGNLLLQLTAGELDYVEGVPPAEHARVEAARRVRLLPFEVLNYDYVGWNGSRAPFDDPSVRLALTLAIDRDAVVDEVLYGSGRVSAGPIPSSARGAPNAQPWPYDPDRARQILRSQGFAPGDDGVLQRDGRRFEITIATNAGNEARRAMVEKIRDQLGEIGVDVKVLQPLEMRTFVSRNVSGDFDAYVGGWTFTTGKAELATLFSSDALPPAGFNVVRYVSDEMDQKLDRLATAETTEERHGALAAIQDQVHRDQPYTFLVEHRRFAAISERARGFRIDAPADSLARLDSAWVASR